MAGSARPTCYIDYIKSEYEAEDKIMDRAEYEKTYPNYCKSCEGWGRFKKQDRPPYISDCDDCIKKGRCPRCGGASLNNLFNCTKCGWDNDDNDRGLPESNVV